MIIDGRSIEAGTRLEADVCVIGAGPAGIAIARAFQGSPWRVVILESGGSTPSDEPRATAATRGESVGHPYIPLELSRARGIGGTSTHWPMELEGDEGWVARPMDAVDLEARAGMPFHGWPFDRASLDPYYARAQVIGRLGPYAYDADDWASDVDGRLLPLDPAIVTTRIVQRGMETFAAELPTLERSRNVRVVVRATAVELTTTDDGGAISLVRARTRSDADLTVRARLVVLACGGLDNPRLLLANRDRWPAGLGNANDLVGRFFMERLTARGAVFLPSGPGFDNRLALYRSHVTGDTRVQATLALAEDLIRREGLLNALFWLRRRSLAATSEGVRSLLVLARASRKRPFPDRLSGHVRNVARDAGPIGRTIMASLPGGHGSRPVIALGVQAEQSPDPDSRVTLGSGTDDFGLPLPRLDWRPAARDRDSIRRTIELLDAAMRSAGLGRLVGWLGDEEPPVVFNGAFHHMGTTRMHPDPRHGVVDADGRVHGLANLYVAGSSIFPSVGCINPTLTIVALAVRLGDHLRDRLDAPTEVEASRASVPVTMAAT